MYVTQKNNSKNHHTECGPALQLLLPSINTVTVCYSHHMKSLMHLLVLETTIHVWVMCILSNKCQCACAHCYVGVYC